MPYPHVFYYKSRSSEPAWETASPGDLNVNRFLAGNPACWARGTAFEEKKKTLVLADWTTPGWSDEKMDKVQRVLYQLLNDGFELYMYQQGSPDVSIPLTMENLPGLITKKYLSKMVPVAEDELIDLTRKDSKTSNPIQVINNYWLDAIINENPDPGPRSIDLADFESAEPLFKDNPVRYQTVFKTSPPIEVITNSRLSLYENFINNQLPDLPVTNRLEYLKISCDEFLPKRKSKNLSDVKKLEVSGGIEEEISSFVLDDLFARMPNLETLILNNITINGRIETENLPDLKRLKLDDARLEEKNLAALLSKSTHLKILELNNLILIKENEIEKYGLDKIADKLLVERLVDDKSLYDRREILAETFQAAHLQSLEYLMIGFHYFSEETLHIIADNAVNLQSLNLIQSGVRPDVLENDVHFTPSLIKINLDNRWEPIYHFGSTLPDKFANHFFAKTAKVKWLNLEIDPPFESRDVNLHENINLTGLEHLDLSGARIPKEKFMKLIDSLPNLKSINVARMKTPITKDLKHYISNRAITLLEADEVNTMNPVAGNVSSKRILTASSSPSSVVADPVHNPAALMEFKLTPEDYAFKFKGENKTQNQTMIIEKFSQYLIHMNKHLEYLPKIRNGMCDALSYLFNEKTLNEWHAFINSIQSWNGQRETLDETLTLDFEEILEKFKESYVYDTVKEETWLGDSLHPLFTLNIGKKLILRNNWHTIAVQSYVYSDPFDIDEDRWRIYDPNFVKGQKDVSSSELKTQIQKCLGSQVSVEWPFTDIKLYIDNADKFIKEGGLLTLSSTRFFTGQTEAIYKQVNSNIDQVSDDSLKQGLLIRSTLSWPAWKHGLHSKIPYIKEYTGKLIEQFALKNPDNFAKILAESISHLSEFEKFATTEALTANNPVFKKIINAIHSKRNIDNFSRQLQTWEKGKPKYESTDAYCQRLVNGLKSKQLIELPSSANVFAMGIALEKYCNRIHRPVYYIHSPDDLVCSAPFVEKRGSEVILKSGQNGGRLHDFLTTNHDKSNPPVLIVNYDNFDADDIVRLNSLLDKRPKADGTPLPDCAMVVGLINPNKPDYYQGESFYSRFGVMNIETCSLKPEQLLPEKAFIPVKIDEIQTSPINLFNASNWKEKLLGELLIKKDHIEFKQGLLSQAIASGLPIEIQNGPFESESFRQFWQRALELGYIDTNFGERISLTNVKFIQSQGYDWNQLREYVTYDHEINDVAPVLNPGELETFFRKYQCDNNTHEVDRVGGLISEYSNKTLEVNVTRDVSLDEWAKLLTECKQYNVNIHCHILQPGKKPVVMGKLAPAMVIESTDIDVTISQLQEKDKWQVIDVSELTRTDLLDYLEGKLDKKTVRFSFTQHENALKSALDENKNIILKGKFSPELADALAPLLLQEQKGKLMAMSDDISGFKYVMNEKHQVTTNEKRAMLKKEKFTEQELNELTTLENEPVCKLRTRLVRGRSDPWQGMTGIADAIKLDVFDEQTSKIKSDQFVQERLKEVNAILEKSPFVFLTGHTGVGKSTFVEKYLQAPDIKLFMGEDKLEKWAGDNSPTRKVLFIDEANLSPKNWSTFEGLFNIPPGMWINRKYYPLDNHKVIFAGNPLNYGNRKMASLFERHGNSIIFDPLPQEFIYEEILKPVFDKTSLKDKTLEISREILNVYQFLCACSNSEVLISPRELQMMALLTLSHMTKNPESDWQAVIRHYVYLLAKDTVPSEKKTHFEERFGGNNIKIPVPHPPEAFTLTPTREPLYQLLHDLTALSEYRCNHAELNDAQKYGGTPAVVIEGEPGIGKSELVYAATETASQKFRHLAVSMQVEEKDKSMLQAFDAGERIIIDEINSAPINERLHNTLTMGKKMDGSRPEYPGSHYIGTQNPSAMPGRFKENSAIKRRRINYILEPYPENELHMILKKKGINIDLAEDMITAYREMSQKAKKERLKPAPTQRDLLNMADNWLEQNLTEKNVVQKNPDIITKSKSSLFAKKPVDYVSENTLNTSPDKGFSKK